MIPKNPLIGTDNLSVLQQIELENNLTEIQIQRGIIGYFPIFISLGITLFGLFGFIVGLTTNQNYIYLGLAFSGALILFIESQRTNLLQDFYSSLLELNVNEEVKKPIFGFFMAIIFTIVFIGLDMFGANSMAIYVKAQMVENKVVNSKAYQLAEAEAKNGTRIQNIYLKEMEEWRKAQRMHNFTCASLPKNYVSKKIACKKEFYIKNPKPKKADIKSSGDVGFGDFTKIENEAKISLNHYDTYFYYAFFILSLLLNYLAVSSIFNQFRAKDRELDKDMIEVLKNRFIAMKTAKLNKMRNSNQAIEDKLDEAYIIDVELEKSNYDINIKRRFKTLEDRNKEINKIEYTKQYPTSKVAKIDIVPTTNQGSNQDDNTNHGYNHGYDLESFNDREKELISMLWDDVKQVGDKLKPRSAILKDIGDNKSNTLMFTTLYQKLTDEGMAYRKGGYIAKIVL